MGLSLTASVLVSIALTLSVPTVWGGQGHEGQGLTFTYIEDGKVTEDQMYAEMPEGVAGSTYPIPGPGSGHEMILTPEEQDYLESNIAYFPSPDDDGTYLRVDMSDTNGLTFHVMAGIRPASITMNIPGFSFGPRRVQESDVKFYLFTKKVTGKNGIELFSMKENKANVAEYWIPGAEVKILCHGYRSSSLKPFPRRMMESYLKLEVDLNVILVDWSDLASSINYFHVAKETFGVGQQAAALIKALVTEGLASLDKVHFIGHSLGAHVGGATGFTLEQAKTGSLPRITGLDPAGPGFCDNEIGQLQISDANFVDVIHTDDSAYCEGKWAWIWNRAKGKWGSDATSGHSNFFPNGGRQQPGCGTGITDSCSHSRAYYYMEESYNATVSMKGSMSTVFKGCPCSTYEEYLKGDCECNSDNFVQMGEYTPINRTEGKYFLKTGNKYPYSHVLG